MTLSRSLAVGSAAVLLFALTACGGSDDGGSEEKDGQGTALTREEFIEKADKVCADGEDDMAALEPAEDATTEEQDQAFRDLADLFLEQAEEIDDLVPPADIADDVDAMVKALVDGATIIKEKGASVVELEANPLAEASIKANELGLEVCGQ